MPACAYCGEMAPVSREHLWPRSLHRRLLAANAQTETTIWLRRADRELPSEPVIKDVCEPCNNVALGKLDNYVCDLFDAQFVQIPKRGKS